MISLEDFIEKFADAVEIEDVDSLSTETVFHDLDEWNSLAYLSVIALLDEEFGVQIEMNEFRKLVTVRDIFDKAQSLSQ